MNENELNLRQAMIDQIECMTGVYGDWSGLGSNQLVILAETLARGDCASEINLRIIKAKIKKFDSVPAYSSEWKSGDVINGVDSLTGEKITIRVP